jgi:hypothetical protein
MAGQITAHYMFWQEFTEILQIFYWSLTISSYNDLHNRIHERYANILFTTSYAYIRRRLLMFDPDANNPYKQPPLPYQSYRGYPNPPLSQQQEFVPPSTTARASASHSSYAASVRSSQAGSTPSRQSSAKSASPRLSKAEALALVGTCKKWLVAGSVVAFGILSGLVAGHVVGSTSTTSTQSTTPASNAPATSPNSPSSNGGFFQQQQQGGFGFGNGNLGQPPVSGSHTS